MREFLLALQHPVELVLVGVDVWSSLALEFQEVVLLADAFVYFVYILNPQA